MILILEIMIHESQPQFQIISECNIVNVLIFNYIVHSEANTLHYKFYFDFRQKIFQLLTFQFRLNFQKASISCFVYNFLS